MTQGAGLGFDVEMKAKIATANWAQQNGIVIDPMTNPDLWLYAHHGADALKKWIYDNGNLGQLNSVLRPGIFSGK